MRTIFLIMVPLLILSAVWSVMEDHWMDAIQSMILVVMMFLMWWRWEA